nr:hypothetical protein [Tanacetum cinerariifolium]
MACIEEIAKDAKLNENDDQLLVLIKRQVETELMLEKKFRYLCEKVSNFVEESEDVVKEIERLSCKDVANKTIRLFRHEQKRELHKMTRLQLMVNTFVSKMNLGRLCGRLLLVCRYDIGFINFTINEMIKGSFVWSVRYLVNIEQLMHLLPEGWSIRTSVWSICLGEGEDDAFVVINISKKVVKYNLISKTTIEVFYIGSNQMDDDDVVRTDFDPAYVFIFVSACLCGYIRCVGVGVSRCVHINFNIYTYVVDLQKGPGAGDVQIADAFDQNTQAKFAFFLCYLAIRVHLVSSNEKGSVCDCSFRDGSYDITAMDLPITVESLRDAVRYPKLARHCIAVPCIRDMVMYAEVIERNMEKMGIQRLGDTRDSSLGVVGIVPTMTWLGEQGEEEIEV